MKTIPLALAFFAAVAAGAELCIDEGYDKPSGTRGRALDAPRPSVVLTLDPERVDMWLPDEGNGSWGIRR